MVLGSPSVHLAKPLPPIPGPRLAPFSPTAYADIQFIEELGNPKVDADSHVWKVKINGQDGEYALTMVRCVPQSELLDPKKWGRLASDTINLHGQFQFNSLQSLRARSYLNRRLASHGLYQDYFEPFNCVCRVYGRLKAEHREDLAVPAHGYLLLTPEQEAEVTERSALQDLSSSDSKYTETIDLFGRLEEHAGLPVHAIVKELVSDRTPFTPAHLQQMWEDMEKLHRLGILINDVKISNFMGGKLVDFSRAMTAPHPSISTMHPEQLWRVRKSEPTQLWDCMIDWGMGNQWDWEEARRRWERESPRGLRLASVGGGSRSSIRVLCRTLCRG